MSTSTNIRIKIVLLMAKFDSLVIVRRTLQAEFSQDTPSEATIRRIFQRFYETGTVNIVNVPEDHQRLQRKRSMRFMMFVELNPI
jgi:hypothetical protein